MKLTRSLTFALLFLIAVMFAFQFSAFANSFTDTPEGTLGFIAFVIAAAITAVQIVSIITPLLVYLATEIVKKLIPERPDWVTLMVIMPALDLGITWLTQFTAQPDLSFWLQLGLGLVSVFIHQIVKLIKGKEA